jgi:hypothetical protein
MTSHPSRASFQLLEQYTMLVGKTRDFLVVVEFFA